MKIAIFYSAPHSVRVEAQGLLFQQRFNARNAPTRLIRLFSNLPSTINGELVCPLYYRAARKMDVEKAAAAPADSTSRVPPVVEFNEQTKYLPIRRIISVSKISLIPDIKN